LCLKAGHLAPKFIFILAILFGYSISAQAGASLKTSLSIEERYESNYLRNPKGSEAEDYVSIFKPGLVLTGSWKTLTVTGSYLADVEKVVRNSQFDHTAHSFSLDIEATPWAKTSMALKERVSYTPNAFDVNALSKVNVLTKYTDIFYNNTYGSLSHKFTDNSSATMYGEYALQDFSDSSLSDTISYSLGLIVSHDILPKWSLSENYEFTRYSFGRGSDGTSDVHLANLGLKGTLSNSLSLELSGGVAYTPGVSSSVDIGSDIKWVAGALVRKEFRKSSFVLEYARAISNAGGISSELSIDDTVTFVAYTTISDNLTANFTGIYAKIRSAPDRLLDTNYYSATVSGNWQINRRFNLSAGYSHYEQLAAESSLASDILGNIVFLKLSTLIYENRF